MGTPVIIYGESGSGKSRSLKNFGENEILLVNVERKSLPFRKRFKYVANTDNVEVIKQQLSKMPVDTAVIDDATFLMVNHFMRKHNSGLVGNEVFEMYNAIADNLWGLFEFVKSLPERKIVYFVLHEDTTDLGRARIRTIGKLLSEKAPIEAMVTIVIRCLAENGRHYFRTVNDRDVTKAPEEMFPAEMENDLKAVDAAIREYYWPKEAAV